MVGSAIIIGVGWTVAALVSRTADWTPVSLVLVLAAFNLGSELLATQSKRRDAAPWATTLSAPLVLAMTLAGPTPAVVIGALGLVAADLKTHSSWLARITNQANVTVFMLTGGLLARWLGTSFGINPGDPSFALLVVGIYAYSNVGTFAINVLSGWLAWGDSIRGQYEQEKMWAAADVLAFPLAVATAFAYTAYGLDALALLVVPQLIYQYLARQLTISRDREKTLKLRADELSQLNTALAQLSESRGHLVGQVLAAEETERRRLAESLHHEALQDLVFAQGIIASQNGNSGQLGAAIGRVVEQLRATIFDLHPAVLKHAGLEVALQQVAEQQAQRAGFEIQVQIDPDACGPKDQLLFALGREQLTNAAKHANATAVSLSIARQNGSVVMQVEDDGCGMDDRCRKDAVEHGHIGFASSIERVEALGGKLEVESQTGQGTRVLTVVPVTGAGNNGQG